MNDGNDETWTQSHLILKWKPECAVMQVRRKDGLIQKFWFVLIMYDFLFTRGKLFLRMEGQGFLSKSISSKCNCIGP